MGGWVWGDKELQYLKHNRDKDEIVGQEEN